jgi:hypothetical protein
MIDCLISYVGLKNVNDSPTSSLFLNDLHGITTNQLKEVREIDENDGIDETWEAIESRAIRLLEMDLMSNLKMYFKNHQILFSDVSGYVDDNTLANHGSGKYAGWLIDVYSQSPSLKIEINDFRIHLASAQNFNFKIFDANTGQELYTKAVVGVEGIQTVKILQNFAVYKHNKLFCCYDTVIPYRAFNSISPPGSLKEGSISTSSTVISTSIDSSESGMMLGYNVRCGIDEFVCSRLNLFLEPYLYKLGIEFLKASKYSDRVNRYTLLDTEQKNELIEEYQLEYQRQIDAVFEDLKVPDDGVCFICNKAINKRVLIP